MFGERPNEDTLDRISAMNLLNFFAAANCFHAKKSTISGARIPISVHFARRRYLLLFLSPGAGTLRCTAVQTHRIKVMTQLRIMPHVPRGMGSLFHPTYSGGSVGTGAEVEGLDQKEIRSVNSKVNMLSRRTNFETIGN